MNKTQQIAVGATSDQHDHTIDATAEPGSTVYDEMPIDQSKRFFGGQHHPWRRFFARAVDIWTGGILLFLLLTFSVGYAAPSSAVGFAKAMETPLVAALLLYLLWIPAEAIFLSFFGATPAKWLFGIRVAHPDGDLLSFSEALKRSVLVWVNGLGIGIPLVALFTQLFAYRRLTRTGTTLWDTSAGAVVTHQRWMAFRALACTVAVVGVSILATALSASGIQPHH